jgi:hypothetical protein
VVGVDRTRDTLDAPKRGGTTVEASPSRDADEGTMVRILTIGTSVAAMALARLLLAALGL